MSPLARLSSIEVENLAVSFDGLEELQTFILQLAEKQILRELCIDAAKYEFLQRLFAIAQPASFRKIRLPRLQDEKLNAFLLSCDNIEDLSITFYSLESYSRFVGLLAEGRFPKVAYLCVDTLMSSEAKTSLLRDLKQALSGRKTTLKRVHLRGGKSARNLLSAHKPLQTLQELCEETLGVSQDVLELAAEEVAELLTDQFHRAMASHSADFLDSIFNLFCTKGEQFTEAVIFRCCSSVLTIHVMTVQANAEGFLLLVRWIRTQLRKYNNSDNVSAWMHLLDFLLSLKPQLAPIASFEPELLLWVSEVQECFEADLNASLALLEEVKHPTHLVLHVFSSPDALGKFPAVSSDGLYNGRALWSYLQLGKTQPLVSDPLFDARDDHDIGALSELVRLGIVNPMIKKSRLQQISLLEVVIQLAIRSNGRRDAAIVFSDALWKWVSEHGKEDDFDEIANHFQLYIASGHFAELLIESSADGSAPIDLSSIPHFLGKWLLEHPSKLEAYSILMVQRFFPELQPVLEPRAAWEKPERFSKYVEAVLRLFPQHINLPVSKADAARYANGVNTKLDVCKLVQRVAKTLQKEFQGQQQNSMPTTPAQKDRERCLTM